MSASCMCRCTCTYHCTLLQHYSVWESNKPTAKQPLCEPAETNRPKRDETLSIGCELTRWENKTLCCIKTDDVGLFLYCVSLSRNLDSYSLILNHTPFQVSFIEGSLEF